MNYWIATYGCQANKADSERIARRLKMMGYRSAKKMEKAGLIVINACAVRQSAMDRVYAKINKFSVKAGKKIILAGCLLEADRKKLKNKVAEIWHPDEYFDYAPIHSNEWSASVPIMTGCNNFCSYCAVPYTRGREKSRPAKEVITEVKNLVKNGYKEIWLLGQNVNSYADRTGVAFFNSRRGRAPERSKGRDKELKNATSVNFSKLLKILNDLPGGFRINFLTSHPKDMSDELIKTVARCEKVSKDIHLPLQSGDNTILKKMNRHYTAAQYRNLVKKIRQKIPGVKISTDVIVGFPGETKKQFQNTVKLFKEIKFNNAYIAKYSPRPGTAAYRLKDNVSLQEKKRRWRILNEMIKKAALLKRSPR